MLKRILNDNHFLSLSTNGFTALFGLLSFMLIARVYDTLDFGWWVLYLAGFSFVEMLKSGLIHGALVKFLAGVSHEEKKVVIGSSWMIGLVLNMLVIGVIYLAFYLFPEKIEAAGMWLFFKYYPLLALVNIPINYTNWISQAQEGFNYILRIRLGLAAAFLIVVAGNLWMSYPVETLVQYHIMLHLALAIFLVIRKKSGLQYLRYYKMDKCRQLFHFGKFSFGTLIGTNLLKSADTFLISFFLGPAFVAMYSVPLRLTEMIEIPLRSLVANALPKIAAASNRNDTQEVKNIFYMYAGILSILFVPFMIFAFVFAEELVTLVGGAKYVDTAIIFRIFCIYGLFLSLDRFTGVTLDAINRPRYNLIKVIWMALANVAGDILVIVFIGEIWAVALVTVLNVLVGVLVGYIFLKRCVDIQLNELLNESWAALKYWLKYRKKPVTDKT
ncbi:oligosaccharide flippase family protein [Fulvivirgaceae bacterium BMA12]|uniref:Oligosaccharide flippase family protein n=1 Tax=Agaribacillus aureus TaxID=3051825 RepID=A0ABT8L1Q0_9BACT|nr:oligosaccharide flippase family protein [Fulvivirgaceae bacterium BMA12]